MSFEVIVCEIVTNKKLNEYEKDTPSGCSVADRVLCL